MPHDEYDLRDDDELQAIVARLRRSLFVPETVAEMECADKLRQAWLDYMAGSLLHDLLIRRRQ